MDHNLTPNPTLSITEGGKTETEAKSPNSPTADLVHGMQQCRGNTMFWKNLHADIVSKIVEGQARWGVIKNCTIRSRYHARMHLLHIKAMKGKIEIAPATAIMVFKESEEMAKLKQEQVERGFELFRNLYYASYPNLIRLEPFEDIYVRGVHDAEQLIHVLGDLEAFIAIDHTRLPVKLIVIDSIAALFRSQYQTTPADFKR
ncbi:unnamed protein product [Prunus brigantina]